MTDSGRTRRPTPGGTRAPIDANTRRLRSERQGPLRRIDAVSTPTSLGFRTRTRVVRAVFLLLGASLIGRGAFLAFGLDPRLDGQLASQHERVVTVAAQRGSILDRLGRPLAVSIELGSVYADPSMVSEPGAAANLLSTALGVPAPVLLEQLSRPGRFVWLARQVPERMSSAVQALGIDGVRVTSESHREYPSGTLAAQALGFVGIDGDGLEGMESRYDALLMGDTFRYRVLRDGRRRPTNHDAVLARRGTEGDTIVLTLDHGIQHRAEMALDAAVLRHEAVGGFVVVMDADTGALYALANHPRFDPNNFRGADPQAFRNRAIGDVFEPGSTMKPFVFAQVLEDKTADTEAQIYCEAGHYRVGRSVVHDAHPEGWLSFADVLKKSSNIGTVKLAESLGPTTLEASYRRFGFGARTGIDLHGEERGILHPSAGWARITFATHAFGQGLSVTGVQMAAAWAALVNGGRPVTPHVLAEVRDTHGRVVEDRRPSRTEERVISEATSAAMRPLLARVLDKDGTGWRATMEEYTAGGKTGTAQKVKDGRYAPGTYVSSFVGFAPVAHPRVVTYVVLDEPRNKYYGGTVAGPVFQEVTDYALRTLGVPPDKGRGPSMLANGAPASPSEESAEEQGDDAQESDPLPTLTEDGEGYILPDLTGLSARDAVLVLDAARVALSVEGSGLVASQDPPGMSFIAPGDAVLLRLSARGTGEGP